MIVCSINNCSRVKKKKTYCEPHYRYILKHGSDEGAENYFIKRHEKQSKVCIWDGCTSATDALSLCTKHHARYLRGHELNAPSVGDERRGHISGGHYNIPLNIKPPIVYTKVDIEDSWVERHKWHIDNKGYATGFVDGKAIFLHHFILGKPEKGFVVDHINRIPLDNSRANLRFATLSENTINSNGPQHRRSKYKGVYKNRDGKFVVSVMRQGVIYYVGTFEDELDAAIEYDCAVTQLHGDNAYTNIIGGSHGQSS